MALINQNSIIGVTSITSPSASNVLTVHTNDTTERLRVSTSGVSFSGTNASLDTSGNISAVDGTFAGNVSIGGTLTYEDVTNVDSIGIVTARNGIHVTGGSVGIGTDNPTESKIVIGHTQTSTVKHLAIKDLTNNWVRKLGVDSSNNFGIFSGDNEQLRITSAGKVGVNTTTAMNAGVMSLYGADEGEGTAKGQLELKDNAAFGSTPTGGIIFSGQHTAGSQAIFAGIRGFKENTNDGNYAGALAFDVRAHGAVAYEALRITSAGKLTVKPADTTSSYATTDGGIDIAQVISSTGTSASQSIGIQFSLTKSGQTGAIAEIGAIREGSGLSGLVFRTRDNTTGRNERLRITSGGYVNIGGDYTQTSRKVMISGGSNVGQLEVKGTEADIWMNSSGVTGGSVWRILGAHGNTTHRWRVYDSTNSRDCINVYNDGSVVTPVQPRFWARLSADQTSYDGRNIGGSWITYDTEEYDIGGNFATSGSDQGRFIAPVAGLYLFQAAAYKQTGTSDWSQSWFDVDGSRKSGTDWVVDSSRFAQNSIQIYLTAGQKVGFHPYNNVSSNTILDSQNHTWFKGCLLG